MKKNPIIIKKKHLKMILEELERYDRPNFKLEQYPIDSNCAADVLFIAGVSFNDIKNKTIIDLGCGTGILSIGSILLGANKVYAVEIDADAIDLGKQNAEKLGISDKINWINMDIKDFNIKGDTVIQNPPFGIRSSRHADIFFLQKAISLANVCYSIHKTSKKNREFLTKYINNLNATVMNIIPLKIDIPQIYHFHKEKKINVEIDLYRIVKNVNEDARS